MPLMMGKNVSTRTTAKPVSEVAMNQTSIKESHTCINASRAAQAKGRACIIAAMLIFAIKLIIQTPRTLRRAVEVGEVSDGIYREEKSLARR
jgi:hypothetical protein